LIHNNIDEKIYLGKKRPFWCSGESAIIENGKLLLIEYTLEFFYTHILATTINGSLPK
jgi:hypothetical protein